MEKFKSIVYNQEADSTHIVSKLTDITLEELDAGDVVIRVAYSSINYKDALAATNAKSGVIPHYPLIGGIDLSGVVISSDSPHFKEGDNVVVTGNGLGVTHHGGYSEIARVPAEWVVKLPDSLSLKEAMIYGTAGVTAALSVKKLLEHGLENQPEAHILITGVTGGVGSIALAILHTLGFQHLSVLTRKKELAADYLYALGAENILSLEDISPDKIRPLLKQRFDFVLDTVGGHQLEIIIPQIAYGGSITLCGNAGGLNFNGNVLPYILRGINLLGVDSVNISRQERLAIWQSLAEDMKPKNLTPFVKDVLSLDQLSDAFSDLIEGTMVGRYLVKI